MEPEKREKFQRMADEMNAASGESSSKRARKSRSGACGGGPSSDMLNGEEGEDSHSSATGTGIGIAPSTTSTSVLAAQLALAQGQGPTPGPRPPGFPFPQSQLGLPMMHQQPGLPQFVAQQQMMHPQAPAGAIASLPMGQLPVQQQQMPRPPFLQYQSHPQQQFIPQSQQFQQQQQPTQFIMQQSQPQFQMQPQGSAQQLIISQSQAQQMQSAQPPFLSVQQQQQQSKPPVAAQFMPQPAPIAQSTQQQFVPQVHPNAQPLVQPPPQAPQFAAAGQHLQPQPQQQAQFLHSQVASMQPQFMQQQPQQPTAPQQQPQQPQFVQAQIPQHSQQIYVIQPPGPLGTTAPGQPGAASTVGGMRFVQQVAFQQQPGAPPQLMLVQHPTAAPGGSGSRAIASPAPPAAPGVLQPMIRPLQAPSGSGVVGHSSMTMSAADLNAQHAAAQADHLRRLQNQMNNADIYIRYA